MAEPNSSGIYGGPASVLADDADIGHTEGGVEVNVAPKNRARTVDIYGDSPIAFISIGDEVKVTAPLKEYTAAVLQAAVPTGNDQTGAVGNQFMGLGRKAGFLIPDIDLKIVPTISAQSAFKVHVYKAVATGSFSHTFKAQEDRMTKIEWQASVDESKSDGQLMGTLMTAGTVQ